MTKEQFIEKIASLVKKYADSYDIKVISPIIAQACLESAYGTSELATNAHNYFGLKYRPNRCPSACGIYHKIGSEQNADGSYTSSAMQWMKFESMEKGIIGYFDFINISNYANLKNVTNPKIYLENIKKNGYATSLKYIDNLMNVINKWDLTKYDEDATTKGDVQMGYTNSSLVNCVVKSPNHSGKRTHRIDRITPHCVVGQLSAESIGGCFTSSSKQASCNYGIGKDGRVCLIVDEANRSWCTSSSANDQRAITIEVASDKTHPYAFTNEAYEKLVELCTDICRRNGIKKLLWLGTKEKSLAYEPKDDEAILTAHRWFANKSCPGDWMYAREGDLANRVTAALGGNVVSTPAQPSQPAKNDSFPTVPFLVQVIVNDLNYRNEPSMKGTVRGQTGKGSFTIVEVSDGWGKLKSGAGWIYLENPEYCTIGKSVGGNVVSTPAPSTPAATSYRVKITANALNIRKGPGTKYGTNGVIRDKGIYTIIEENNGWGKLKSGAGWISLSYAQKL